MLGEKSHRHDQRQVLLRRARRQGDGQVQNHCAPTSQQWYPVAPWDWFYGRGYWWFAYDYDWYPGWNDWGCWAPTPWWYGDNRQPPEEVANAEMPLPADGKLKIDIDTAPAKELHPDQDHEYTITAEVVDESRRIIVGTGNVLVARKPFKVFAWLDRGYYRTGDTIRAMFSWPTRSTKSRSSAQASSRSTRSATTRQQAGRNKRPRVGI